MTVDRVLTTRRVVAFGFSLVELLVVIAVVAILAGLILAAGGKVVERGKVRQTEQVLTNLDRALDEYITSEGTIPPYDPTLWERVPGPDATLTSFGTGSVTEHPARPDSSVFLRQTAGFGEVDAIVAGLPEGFLRVTPVAGAAANTVDGDPTPTVVDAWAEPGWPQGDSAEPFPLSEQQVVYYVHPGNVLAQELYGRCVNDRPYFVSAGPDERYGFRGEAEAVAGAGATNAELVEAVEEIQADNITSYATGPANLQESFLSEREVEE